MILYEVMAEGFHTPLTREEIAEFYHAGRIERNAPCKLAAKSEWRTVDELFPLLKYDATWGPKTLDRGRDASSRWIIAAASFAALVIVATITIAFARSGRAMEIATASPRPQQEPVGQPRGSGSLLPMQASAASQKPVPLRPPHRRVDLETQQVRLEGERIALEQLLRDQAANAERVRRESGRLAAERQRADGTDTIVPLETDYPVNVGGQLVRVRVHDNDVTSFDVRVDGRWYREVKKQKGITQSRTDETLIYRNGRASLYYVWELSGKLNHCRLRVREG